jgi:hypothetical protein
LNVFACIAASQSSCVDLIISGFEISSIFCDEIKCDFIPLSIFPVGSDEEGDISEPCLERFDREEKVSGGFGFEVADSYVKRNCTYCDIWVSYEGIRQSVIITLHVNPWDKSDKTQLLSDVNAS